MNEIPFTITTTNYDPALAEITIQYSPNQISTEDQPVTVSARIAGPWCNDQLLSNKKIECEITTDDHMVLRASLAGPKFWSNTSPNLYRCHVELKQESKEPVNYTIDWGIKTLQIHRSRFELNGQRHLLRGVRVNDLPTQHFAEQCRQHAINTLFVPMAYQHLLESVPAFADTHGLHVLYELNADEEHHLWLAETHLLNHISTLGWVLPQSDMANAQLWHNAMLHLHGHRRDVFVGIMIEKVPLSMVQGHVDFLLVPMQFLPSLENVQVPKVASVRRFDLLEHDASINLAGTISRTLAEG